jgi:hypothetical protein
LLGKLYYGEVDYYHGIGPYGQFRRNTRKDAGRWLLTAVIRARCLVALPGRRRGGSHSYDTKSRSKIFAPHQFTTTSVTILKFKNGTVGKCAAVVDCLQPYYFHTHLVGSEGSLLTTSFIR